MDFCFLYIVKYVQKIFFGLYIALCDIPLEADLDLRRWWYKLKLNPHISRDSNDMIW